MIANTQATRNAARMVYLILILVRMRRKGGLVVRPASMRAS